LVLSAGTHLFVFLSVSSREAALSCLRSFLTQVGKSSPGTLRSSAEVPSREWRHGKKGTIDCLNPEKR
jgi:hypothetical protein